MGSERFRLLYVVLHAPLESSYLMEVIHARFRFRVVFGTSIRI